MNRQFTAFSGLAIAFVVINHSLNLGLSIPPMFGHPQSSGAGYQVLIQIGVYAVPTFLFISGSFFAYAAQPNLLYKVAWNNLRRLLIPYILWSIIFYILIFLGQGMRFSVWGYLKNLAVGYPFWFVPLIVFYYLISPLLIFLGKRFKWALIASIGIYQIVLINIVNPGILGFSFPGWMRFLAPPVIRGTLALWAIYFPLGLIFGLNAKSIMPWIQKMRWVLIILTVIMFLLLILYATSILPFPLVIYICPLTFVMLIPIIKRDSIPFVRVLEKLGKRSFGLYLASWNVIYSSILAIHALIPGLLNYQIPFYSLLIALSFGIPLGLMSVLSLLPNPVVYHYVFD